jgi:hypothetical protein
LLVAGLVLSACGTISLASSMQSWVAQSSFSSTRSSIDLDVRHSATALRVAAMTSAQLHTVCGVLEFELEEANASLPAPDRQSTSLLSRSYGQFGVGASECYRAGSSVSARRSALAALSRGMATLSEAVARVNVASGRAP